jgi:hypothetical protein
MSTSNQTVQKSGGLTGVMKSSFKAGLGAAESMHQFAVEIPLNLLAVVGVPEDKTTMLKDKHRGLLRGLYGSVDAITTRALDLGAEEADILTAEASRQVANAKEVVAEVTKPEKKAAKAKKPDEKVAEVTKADTKKPVASVRS